VVTRDGDPRLQHEAVVGHDLSLRAELEGAGPDAFPGNGKLPATEEENRRLRRELEGVRQERDFLKKAAAYFAKESR